MLLNYIYYLHNVGLTSDCCQNVLSNYTTVSPRFLPGPQRNLHVTARSLHGPRGRRYLSARMSFYPNHDASFTLTRIAISGDVEFNPGPDTVCTSLGSSTSCQNSTRKPVWKFPCDVCAKPVRSNQKGIMCDGCDKWFHLKCITMDLRTYIDLSSSDEQWFCDGIACASPFNFSDSFFEPTVSADNVGTSMISTASENGNPSTFSSAFSLTRHINARPSNDCIKCLLLNVRSIRYKIHDLQTLLLMDDFDIIALTETWLDENFDDRELHLDDYNIFRRDRRGRGGGVLLATKLYLPCIRRYDLEVDAEMVVCQITTSASQHLLFSVFYRPPNAGEAFLESFKNFLDVTSNTGVTDVVITGDFNFPCMDWSTGSATVTDNLTESFCEILDDNFLIQTNHYVTRFKDTGSAISSGNILDLVLTNNDALIVDTSVYPNSFDSDHLPVCFSIKSKFKRPSNNTTRKLYCYDKADFDGLRNSLSHVPWELFISSDDIDSSAVFFQDQVLAAVEQHIPTMKLKQKARPPWIDKDVMKLVRKKKALWKRLKNNPSTELTSNFKLLRKETKKLISSKYCKYLKSLADKLKSNPK